jgi:hypothetical protein
MGHFFSDLRLLLGLRWTLTFNTFRGALGGSRRCKCWAWSGSAGGWASCRRSSASARGRCCGASQGSGLEALLPGLILTAVALLILFSSFAVALGSLFLSGDLETLMIAPVSRRAVFTAKISTA